MHNREIVLKTARMTWAVVIEPQSEWAVFSKLLYEIWRGKLACLLGSAASIISVSASVTHAAHRAQHTFHTLGPWLLPIWYWIRRIQCGPLQCCVSLQQPNSSALLLWHHDPRLLWEVRIELEEKPDMKIGVVGPSRPFLNRNGLDVGTVPLFVAHRLPCVTTLSCIRHCAHYVSMHNQSVCLLVWGEGQDVLSGRSLGTLCNLLRWFEISNLWSWILVRKPNSALKYLLTSNLSTITCIQVQDYKCQVGSDNCRTLLISMNAWFWGQCRMIGPFKLVMEWTLANSSSIACSSKIGWLDSKKKKKTQAKLDGWIFWLTGCDVLCWFHVTHYQPKFYFIVFVHPTSFDGTFGVSNHNWIHMSSWVWQVRAQVLL